MSHRGRSAAPQNPNQNVTSSHSSAACCQRTNLPTLCRRRTLHTLRLHCTVCTHTRTAHTHHRSDPPHSIRCLHLGEGEDNDPEEEQTGGRLREDVGKRRQDLQRGAPGEAERRSAAAVEEEALRPDRGRRAAAAAEAARPPAPPSASAPPPRRRRDQDQGAALCQHEDGGLCREEREIHLLHRCHAGGQGDRLQVPTGRGLERGDHPADGAVQEQTGDPGGEVDETEAAPARGADPGAENGSQLAKRCVTPLLWTFAICGQLDIQQEDPR